MVVQVAQEGVRDHRKDERGEGTPLTDADLRNKAGGGLTRETDHLEVVVVE